MLLTDAADLMEVFAELFGQEAIERIKDRSPGNTLSASETDSYLTSPMSELSAPPRSMAEVYGDSGTLLAHLADIAARNGEQGLADLMMDLARIVADERLYAGSEPTRSRRLVEYVYPVV